MREYIVSLSGDWANKQGEKLTEIVRCRDCKYHQHNSYHRCDLYTVSHEVEPDGFCAWAKRKEDSK